MTTPSTLDRASQKKEIRLQWSSQPTSRLILSWWPASNDLVQPDRRSVVNSVVLCTIRSIWLERNRCVFKNKSLGPPDVVTLIQDTCKDWRRVGKRNLARVITQPSPQVGCVRFLGTAQTLHFKRCKSLVNICPSRSYYIDAHSSCGFSKNYEVDPADTASGNREDTTPSFPSSTSSSRLEAGLGIGGLQASYSARPIHQFLAHNVNAKA